MLALNTPLKNLKHCALEIGFNISGLEFTPFLKHNFTLHECEDFMEVKGKHA
jgi:hypothetical protein